MAKQREENDFFMDTDDFDVEESSSCLEYNPELIDLYDYYINEISDISCNNSEENEKLILEIYTIVKKLDELFDYFDCDDSILSGLFVPWIDDKVSYCLKNCNDIDKLKELNDLYFQFVEKRNQIVEGNLRLVISIAKKYYRDNQISFNDVIQFGNIGLMRSVEKYNPEFNTAFSTYAYFWIRQNIIKNFRRVSSALDIPYYLVDDYCFLTKGMNELYQELGRAPTNKELADYTGNSISKIENLIVTFSKSISLDEPLEMSYDDSCASRIDYIPDDSVDVYEEVSINELKEQLVIYMSEYLTEREQLVLRQRFGIECKQKTFVEIAEGLGLTYQRVGQIQNHAIKKLRKIPQIKSMISYFR